MKYTIKEYTKIQKQKMKAAVEALVTPPSLNIYYYGDNPANASYMKGKLKDCAEVGIRATAKELDFDSLAFGAGTRDCCISKAIEESCETKSSYIFQLPIEGVSNAFAIDRIGSYIDYDEIEHHDYTRPRYDADGFGSSGWNCKCTPLGIIRYLQANDYEFEGKTAVVVGRSELVGKPMAELLLEANMTVTICHRFTPYEEVQKLCSQADLIIVAVGKPKFLKFDTDKRPTIIDVGINKVDGKLCGDVDYDYMKPQCEYISPVPGGVGLLTRLALLENVLRARPETSDFEK